MPDRARAALWLTVLCATVVPARGTIAQESRCPRDDRVVVRSATRADADAACSGAEEAIEFLRSLGMSVPARVELNIVPVLPAPVGGAAYGCYVTARDAVFMLPYDQCAARKDAELVVDRTLYKSLVAHEVGHLVAAANFSAKPGLLAQEYVAYITMFATLPPEERERLLASLPGDGFDSPREMTLTYYMLAPTRFGAQAYRHFLKSENGRAFVQQVLTGNVLGDEEGE